MKLRVDIHKQMELFFNYIRFPRDKRAERKARILENLKMMGIEPDVDGLVDFELFKMAADQAERHEGVLKHAGLDKSD